VPAHRATSAVLSHAYPFLAEGGLGTDGAYIGLDVFSGGAFTYDPWVMYRRGFITNPNMLIAGVVGTGKSSTAKALACRGVAFGRTVYIPSDPKGEWTPVVRRVGGVSYQLGPGLPTRLNPLDAGPRPSGLSEREWTRIVWTRRRVLIGTLTESMLGRPLQPTEHTALDLALSTACHKHAEPILPHVVDQLIQPDPDAVRAARLEPAPLTHEARNVAHALRRLVRGDLADTFDAPSTQVFDPNLPMVSLDLSRIGAAGDHTLRVAITCASAWLEAAIADPASGLRWVIYDEAWRTMQDAALLRRMRAQWKLSRAHGIANLMIVHRLSDLEAVGDAGTESRALAEGLLADCSTRIMMRQETDQLARTATVLGLTDIERQVIGRLPVGRGLWKIGQRSFVVHTTLHPDEAKLFDTSARMRALANGARADRVGR
jgi:hypothetical protein